MKVTVGRGAERVILIGMFATVLGLSAYNSALRTDSHHWGLMLSQAIDLHEGRVPYKDFIIVYGYFTTAVQSLWGGMWGFSFLSLGMLTATAYCGLLYQAYLMIKHLSDARVAMLFLAVAFLLHPFPTYPWPDYYAGFWLTWALGLLVANRSGAVSRLVFGGILLGLAVWSRYTYAVAVVPLLAALLVTGQYSFRRWMVLLASFVGVNLIFVAVLKVGYGIHLFDALRIYREAAESVSKLGGDWFSLQQISRMLFASRLEDAVLIYLWLATFPLFLEALKTKRLGKREVGIYIALSMLGFVNLIHAMRGFEYFRMINSSVALAVVSFWMIGNATSALWNRPASAEGGSGTWGSSIRKVPILLAVPALFLGVLSIRIVSHFPLNTYNWGHDPEIWRNTRGFSELTFGKVGYVNFSNADMLDFYRNLSLEICGKSKIINTTRDSVVGQVCGHPRNVRMDQLVSLDLALLDQTEYQRIFVRGELSDDDVIVAQGNAHNGILCSTRSELRTPSLEWVGKAGTTYYVLKRCFGGVRFGPGWSPEQNGRRWAVSPRAEIHVVSRIRTAEQQLRVTLEAVKPQTVVMRLNDEVLGSLELRPGHQVSYGPEAIQLVRGDNLLSFDTAPEAEQTAGGERVRVAYTIHNLVIRGTEGN